jgi:DNA-binding response OmpR family regulator
MNILVVSKNNKLAHSVLQAINIYLPGNELITACNSHECLNINQTHAVDIFIIDLDLIDNTDYDVFDIIKIIRSTTDTKSIQPGCHSMHIQTLCRTRTYRMYQCNTKK